jgi:hypothetical protein
MPAPPPIAAPNAAPAPAPTPTHVAPSHRLCCVLCFCDPAMSSPLHRVGNRGLNARQRPSSGQPGLSSFVIGSHQSVHVHVVQDLALTASPTEALVRARCRRCDRSRAVDRHGRIRRSPVPCPEPHQRSNAAPAQRRRDLVGPGADVLLGHDDWSAQQGATLQPIPVISCAITSGGELDDRHPRARRAR